MSTISLVLSVVEFKFFQLVIKLKFLNYSLPLNSVAKSATADFVLFNSVLVVAKFVFVVFKSFEVAEPFHSIKTKTISNNKT
jgi:hypothetical protein